ncbi:MAG: hypothetical protein GYA12_03085 [Chloroflexi bacterium]|nr:hypothetical protein [Chloroflexota bacterium]
MLSSLRSRLWLSYSIVILIALVGMIGPTISALSRSPLFYRQTVLQLRLAQSSLINMIKLGDLNDTDRIKTIVVNQSRIDGIRYAVINNNGNIIIDSGSGIFSTYTGF